jgi:hypothetical protein
MIMIAWVWLCIGLGYCLALFLLIRAFDLIHQWDEKDERLFDSFSNELRKKSPVAK